LKQANNRKGKINIILKSQPVVESNSKCKISEKFWRNNLSVYRNWTEDQDRN